ncbi:MAG: response regulator transcription factor [Pseudomonadales bacterium]|jgi:DNA-binding NarL/FixJ family response regulator|nr:response regulator transcription factor [Pseudomonadales bacterium]
MVHRGTSENRGSGDQQRRLTVLLVEDSQLLAARLSELLEHIGNIQLVGPVATESLALSSARQNKPDVIILDLHLREGTGFGVLRGLRGSQPRPVVIVLTNYALDAYRKAALELGAEYFLDKSAEFQCIPAVIAEVTRPPQSRTAPSH